MERSTESHSFLLIFPPVESFLSVMKVNGSIALIVLKCFGAELQGWFRFVFPIAMTVSFI